MTVEIDAINRRLDLLESGHKNIERSLEYNNKLTKDISNDTQDIISLFRDMKSVVRWFNLIQRTITWLAKIALAIAAIWAVIWAIITGRPPSMPAP